MKLTSTNRPFGLTIKFTRHTCYPTFAQKLVRLWGPRAPWRTCQGADLDGGSALNCSEVLMLFSCERSPCCVDLGFSRIAPIKWRSSFERLAYADKW